MHETLGLACPDAAAASTPFLLSSRMNQTVYITHTRNHVPAGSCGSTWLLALCSLCLQHILRLTQPDAAAAASGFSHHTACLQHALDSRALMKLQIHLDSSERNRVRHEFFVHIHEGLARDDLGVWRRSTESDHTASVSESESDHSE